MAITALMLQLVKPRWSKRCQHHNNFSSWSGFLPHAGTMMYSCSPGTGGQRCWHGAKFPSGYKGIDPCCPVLVTHTLSWLPGTLPARAGTVKYSFPLASAAALLAWSKVPIWLKSVDLYCPVLLTQTSLRLPGTLPACAGTVKYSFPLASAAALLAWGLLEFPAGYQGANLAQAQGALRWATDYLLACQLNDANGSFVAQVRWAPAFLAQLGRRAWPSG